MTTERPHLAKPVDQLELTHRARAACETLGLANAEDIARCPDADFLAIPGCGEKTLSTIRACIAALTDAASPPRGEAIAHNGMRLLPDELLDFELHRFFLPDNVCDALRRLDIERIGDLLPHESALVHEIGAKGVAAIRTEIRRVVQRGTQSFEDELRDQGSAFRAFIDRLFSELDTEQCELLRRRFGLGRPAESPLQIATKWEQPEHEVTEYESRTVAALHQSYAELLDRVRNEALAELNTFDQMLTGQHLVPGTILHSAAQSSGDPDLPLRLIAVLLPQEFTHHGTFLSKMSTREYADLLATLQRLCKRSSLPRSVEDLQHQLTVAGHNVPHDMITHVVRRHLQRAIIIDPVHGEQVTIRAGTVAERAQQLLEERARPTPFHDLMFDYRERFRRVHGNILRDHLRADSRFLEVGSDVWSLRDRHLDELELARVEAQRISGVICTEGGRHSVHELADETTHSGRQVHMIADILRHDPALRDLGRGEFCPRNQAYSQVMAELVSDLKRAMGEIPMSRFLTNQPPHRRTLIERLLYKNRKFVSPNPDRVDLLSNYPFDFGRVRRALIATDQCLEQHGGYSNLDHIREALHAIELGGEFLTEHFVVDLLGRHGDYEFLPGGIVAQASLGLTGWIQYQAREAIRACGGSLTSEEVILEKPELAEFGQCLDELLSRDPLLLSHDGDRFQVA